MHSFSVFFWGGGWSSEGNWLLLGTQAGVCEGRCAGHLEDPGDVAGSGTAVSEFYYFLPGGVGQRSTIYKHTTKLVHATVTYMETKAPESSRRREQGG